MINQITCGQCALWQPESKTCRLYKGITRNSQDSCPEGTSKLEKCDICGREILPSQIIIDMGLEHTTHIICPNCDQIYYTCNTCAQSLICDFETNPIDLPKQIQQQMQTGNGYIVTTVKNPSRIEKTCKVNCTCWNEENGCLKQNNYCNKHQILWKV